MRRPMTRLSDAIHKYRRGVILDCFVASAFALRVAADKSLLARAKLG